jgi:ABC-type proline/glycine betaine transport systems, periplasmic components
MKKRLMTAVAIGAVALLGLTACSQGDGSSHTLKNGDKKDITIGVFNGWPEGEAASYVWKTVLEAKGYNVSLKYAEAGPVFAAVSKGDYDLALDAWLPTTHASYMKQYGRKLIDLGAWNSEAKLTMAVNADAPIDSLDQLAAIADKFGNKIVGIEPGAGLTEAVQTRTIPEYGLDKMKFITSSTPAMLAELKKATSSRKNIVVTLWKPQWAYDAFDIKDLKDPKKTLGTAESIHSIASLDFEKDYPTVTKWMKSFKFPSDKLFSLENAMYNGTGDVKDYSPVVKKWLGENKDFETTLTK